MLLERSCTYVHMLLEWYMYAWGLYVYVWTTYVIGARALATPPNALTPPLLTQVLS
jgi:hypothetical protein